MNNDLINLKINNIVCSIIENRQLILNCLQHTETYKTAQIEIDKSISCLQNIDKQIKYLIMDSFIDLCIFLPMNQPLYSLTLFAIIPGCMFENIFCRPPVLLKDVYSNLCSILNLSNYNIFCQQISRRKFLKYYVAFADAIIYTGKYENAIEVTQWVKPKSIFIFQGSGTNPIIITENAIINDELISKVIKTQIYNSGQDCMAPSAIFVSKNKWFEFIQNLIEKLRVLKVGNYSDTCVDIAPMIEESSIEVAKSLLDSNQDSIIYGGEVDFEHKIVFPTIIEFKTVYELPFQSSFSPIFCLYCYQNEKEILEFLERPECQENKAYISVFGSMYSSFGNEIVIDNDVLDSVDDGYSEFGGFGVHSSFVMYNKILTAKPILISKELAEYHNVNGVIIPTGSLENPTYEISVVLSNIELSKKFVLEVGCGTIPHAKYLAPYCGNYIAVDINQNKVKNAISNNILGNLDVEIMNGADLKYADQSFDIVLMFHCFHEVTIGEQGFIIKEIYRVLKKNGYLLIIDTTSEFESEFQKCFNIIHENFFDCKHIYSVKHSEWVICKYVEKGFFREIKNEIHNMIFEFSTLEDLRDCLLRSFMYEYNWDDASKQKLTNLINRARLLDEIMKFRVLKKN